MGLTGSGKVLVRGQGLRSPLTGQQHAGDVALGDGSNLTDSLCPMHCLPGHCSKMCEVDLVHMCQSLTPTLQRWHEDAEECLSP